jgi:hypothetical protein
MNVVFAIMGNLENLQNLLFVFLVSNTALPLEELLSLLPLSATKLGRITARLHDFQYLRLFQPFESSVKFTEKLFPSLTESHTNDTSSSKLSISGWGGKVGINRSEINEKCSFFRCDIHCLLWFSLFRQFV